MRWSDPTTVAHALACHASCLTDTEAETLRTAADALALSEADAEQRLEDAERLLAKLEMTGRIAWQAIESVHAALRGIDSRIPLPC